MALQDAIVVFIGDIISVAINAIAKKLGCSEVKAKQIEAYLSWFVLLSFIAVLCFITFKYS